MNNHMARRASTARCTRSARAATRRCWGPFVLPESEGVEDEDIRWFTLAVDLESLSPHRSREPDTASAVGSAAAQPSSGCTQQPPTGGQGPGGRTKRPAVQLSLAEEDPTRHADNQPGQQLLTGRAKRQHRQHATTYRFRIFTEDTAQAAFDASTQDSVPPSASAVLQCECSCAGCAQSDGGRTPLGADDGPLHFCTCVCWGEPFAPWRIHAGRAVRAGCSERSLQPCRRRRTPQCAAPVHRRPEAPGLSAPLDARVAAARRARARYAATQAASCGGRRRRGAAAWHGAARA